MSSSGPWTVPVQIGLFGVAFAANDRTMSCEACKICGATNAYIDAGRGPHWASLKCAHGHFLRWLPKPAGGR